MTKQTQVETIRELEDTGTEWNYKLKVYKSTKTGIQYMSYLSWGLQYKGQLLMLKVQQKSTKETANVQEGGGKGEQQGE